MIKSKSISALALVAMLAVMSALSACHTTAGAGEDISDSGKAIEHSAQRNTP